MTVTSGRRAKLTLPLRGLLAEAAWCSDERLQRRVVLWLRAELVPLGGIVAGLFA